MLSLLFAHPCPDGIALNQVASVAKTAQTIDSLTLENGQVYAAKVFVDGTYEGDLMARSGTSFTWGRESKAQYNESFGGRREPYSRMDWASASPFNADGSLLFPLVTDAVATPLGTGDSKASTSGLGVVLQYLQ